MKNIFKIIVLITFCSSINIQAQKIKTITGFNHIESVATDGKFLYAADIGKALNPSAKDGDGSIIKLDKKGNVIALSWALDQLNAPKGLTIDKGILFANDIDRLVAFDLKSGAKLYEINFEKETSFLNDIAVWDHQTLYVSATDKNKLFQVNLIDKSYTEVKTEKPIWGINGLFCYKKANRLYVNGLGENNQSNGVVGYINLKDKTFTQLTTLQGLYDGIFISDDVLYVSNWVAFEKKGIIQGIGIYGARKIETVNTTQPIAGPADFIILNNTLIIPAMISGEILLIELDRDLKLRL
ncbi:hypothetical protein KIH23_11815 [Flavobacterium sp. CYK-55]|uniref:hypothetical protein n=1 Tax=Flavobacterium sp. CYK-55 TaxID=2835529 RepID=UPI001BCE382E|nr:hypothetical protein [Flavobacterium sp. CYK-55]MBS7787984.1 hypothetical protein [Flavobacterium sp. CYK-55]